VRTKSITREGCFRVVLSTAVAIISFIGGMVLLTFSSDKAVEHSVTLAKAIGMSPFLIGFLLVSLGTDLPEIANSITSCALGHGDIDVGDSLGSVLTQITLVPGILAFIGGVFRLKRKEVAVVGSCQILAIMLSISIVEKGYFTHLDGLFLVISWILFMFLSSRAVPKKHREVIPIRRLYHILMAILGFIGVALGAYMLVQSIIALSAFLNVHEYIISFFLASIGTSLPELVVDLTAIRKKEYELVIGDIIGSCVVDASLSIGIGQMLFPTKIQGELARITGNYALFASIIVLLVFIWRKKLDKKAGGLFLFLYASSYLLLFIP